MLERIYLSLLIDLKQYVIRIVKNECFFFVKSESTARPYNRCPGEKNYINFNQAVRKYLSRLLENKNLQGFYRLSTA